MRQKEVVINISLACVLLLMLWCIFDLADPSRPIEGVRKVFLLGFQVINEKAPAAIDRYRAANSDAPSPGLVCREVGKGGLTWLFESSQEQGGSSDGVVVER